MANSNTLSETDKDKIIVHLLKAVHALAIGVKAAHHFDLAAVEDCQEFACKHLEAINEISCQYNHPAIRETCSLESIAEQYPDEPAEST